VDASPLIALALVHLAAVAVPGPNVLAVAHAAAGQSRRAGLLVAAGVSAGAFIWAIAAALGLGLLIARFEGLGVIIRIAGGITLIAIGLLHLRGGGDSSTATRDATLRSLLRGTGVNLTNPKSLVFFGSVFAAVLPADATTELRLAAVALITVDSLLFHALLALALSTRAASSAYARASGVVRRTVGFLFIAFGARLAVAGRMFV
jgi:threonine efflux protein